MPDHSGRVGERGDLVDDDAPPSLVAVGAVPGRAEHRVQGGRRAPLDGQRQLRDQLPFPRLLGRRAFPGHHVVRGDRLEQGALQQLPARHDEAGRVTGEGAVSGGGERRLFGGLAEAAYQLAGEVLRRGEGGRAAVEAEPPAGQLHEFGEDGLEFGRRGVPRASAVRR